jgi:broad specificity phosphatase PhoE
VQSEQAGVTEAVTQAAHMQATSRQMLGDPGSQAAKKRLILVRHAATVSSEETRLHESMDEPCSALGEVQAMKVGEFLMDVPVDNLLVSPAERAVFTAAAIAKCQSLASNRAPRLQMLDDLRNVSVGEFSGRLAKEVHSRACCRQQPRMPMATAHPHGLPALLHGLWRTRQ